MTRNEFEELAAQIIEESINYDVYEIPDVDEEIIKTMKMRIKDAGQEA